ncbi:MAG: hypothetical protein M1831_004965 [Alyxoria varia]|nr:MAG: hypothetical protein M1831_004965 [Alyxoria varia]
MLSDLRTQYKSPPHYHPSPSRSPTPTSKSSSRVPPLTSSRTTRRSSYSPSTPTSANSPSNVAGGASSTSNQQQAHKGRRRHTTYPDPVPSTIPVYVDSSKSQDPNPRTPDAGNPSGGSGRSRGGRNGGRGVGFSGRTRGGEWFEFPQSERRSPLSKKRNFEYGNSRVRLSGDAGDLRPNAVTTAPTKEKRTAYDPNGVYGITGAAQVRSSHGDVWWRQNNGGGTNREEKRRSSSSHNGYTFYDSNGQSDSTASRQQRKTDKYKPTASDSGEFASHDNVRRRSTFLATPTTSSDKYRNSGDSTKPRRPSSSSRRQSASYPNFSQQYLSTHHARRDAASSSGGGTDPVTKLKSQEDPTTGKRSSKYIPTATTAQSTSQQPAVTSAAPPTAPTAKKSSKYIPTAATAQSTPQQPATTSTATAAAPTSAKKSSRYIPTATTAQSTPQQPTATSTATATAPKPAKTTTEARRARGNSLRTEEIRNLYKHWEHEYDARGGSSERKKPALYRRERRSPIRSKRGRLPGSPSPSPPRSPTRRRTRYKSPPPVASAWTSKRTYAKSPPPPPPKDPQTLREQYQTSGRKSVSADNRDKHQQAKVRSQQPRQDSFPTQAQRERQPKTSRLAAWMRGDDSPRQERERQRFYRNSGDDQRRSSGVPNHPDIPSSYSKTPRTNNAATREPASTNPTNPPTAHQQSQPQPQPAIPIPTQQQQQQPQPPPQKTSATSKRPPMQRRHSSNTKLPWFLRGRHGARNETYGFGDIVSGAPPNAANPNPINDEKAAKKSKVRFASRPTFFMRKNSSMYDGSGSGSPREVSSLRARKREEERWGKYGFTDRNVRERERREEEERRRRVEELRESGGGVSTRRGGAPTAGGERGRRVGGLVDGNGEDVGMWFVGSWGG